MKRFAALMLVLSLAGCRTFIQNEFVDVPNYDVDLPEPEFTYLRDNADSLVEDFNSHCSFIYELMKDSDEEYWMLSEQDVLASEHVLSAFPGQEEELAKLGSMIPMDGPPFIVNSVCDFDGKMLLGLLAGEMGEYVSFLGTNDSGELIQSELIGGVMDAHYYLGEMPNVEGYTFWKGYGDAGHFSWAYHQMNPNSFEMELIEDCGLSYDLTAVDPEPNMNCSLEFKR